MKHAYCWVLVLRSFLPVTEITNCPALIEMTVVCHLPKESRTCFNSHNYSQRGTHTILADGSCNRQAYTNLFAHNIECKKMKISTQLGCWLTIHVIFCMSWDLIFPSNMGLCYNFRECTVVGLSVGIHSTHTPRIRVEAQPNQNIIDLGLEEKNELAACICTELHSHQSWQKTSCMKLLMRSGVFASIFFKSPAKN